MNGLYKTIDLRLVCTLMLNNISECNIEKNKNNNKYSFIYEKTPEMIKIKSQFYNNEIKVNPIDYMKMIRHYKQKLDNINE